MDRSEKKDRNEIDRKFLEMLVCPLTHTNLEFDQENRELLSNAAKLAYPGRDANGTGLPAEARPLED